MAEQFVGLALQGVAPAVNHYGPVKRKVKEKMPSRRGRNGSESAQQTWDEVDEHSPEERGLVLRKRSEVRSDEEIVERVPRRSQQANGRPGLNRRPSSMDGYDNDRYPGDRRVGAYRGSRGGDYYDSEGSVPPYSRAGRGRAKSGGGRGRSSSSSSSSSSDLGSSTDDEKKEKKIKHKKWITAGLASVATIHAAAKLYNSLEAHDKRVEQVKSGELSPEEARKKRNAARWQDAAAVGIAALGIKGTMSEWSEVKEAQHEHSEQKRRHAELHEKRIQKERLKRQAYKAGYPDREDQSSGQRW